jgi:heme a synthase
MNFIANNENKNITLWLMICALLVVCMVAIGGYTRLSNSGLSIVEWKPVTGAIPPLSANDWSSEFSKYKTTPEFIKINSDMSLIEFKNIYLVEYFHRLLGRVTGLVFIAPFVFFFFAKRMHKTLSRKLLFVFMLGSVQGFIGWYMVSSGLVNDPAVSAYRLALHLSMAIIIYALIINAIMDTKPLQALKNITSGIYTHSIFTSSLILLQIASGAFVAGNDAGLIYNTFPLMGEAFVPEGVMSLNPWYLNFFDNHANVQFSHRILAYLNLINGFMLYYNCRRVHIYGEVRVALNIFILALLLQVGLGILTILKQVPTDIALTHQLGAIWVFTQSFYLTEIFGRSFRKKYVEGKNQS